jgi:putative transposon-encoded protein
MATNQKRSKDDISTAHRETGQGRVKFEVYGEEMVEKEVKMSGNSGRVYLPPDWVGHQVKIVRID